MNIRQISPQLDSGVPSDFEELNGEFEEDGEDMDRIFAGIDWATANLGALEQEWRNQLAEIEQVPLSLCCTLFGLTGRG